jgi:DNA (cytosine-5)-methyltransferase 1
MKHGSLFSGIGGFDLAAEWMGWENVFHCEWNPFGQRVLHHYWPNAEQFTDITKTDFTKYANKIDILTGGFPCQPYSSAGKRLGKEDDRHLWPEMLRAIREIQPRWVVGENVLGLVNWNGGLVFNEVQTDLETQGYEVQPYVLPAVSVNAPHRRDRVWFVAYSVNNRYNANGRKISKENRVSGIYRKGMGSREFDRTDISKYPTNTKNIRQEYALENGELERGRFGQSHQRNAWDSFPSVSPICTGDDGISDRLDSITFPKWRNESIKAGGNAIVPQVVYQIFKAIQQYELLTAPATDTRQSS